MKAKFDIIFFDGSEGQTFEVEVENREEYFKIVRKKEKEFEEKGKLCLSYASFPMSWK